MKITVLCDSFKGTLSSAEAGAIICEAFKAEGLADTAYFPATDGGDGMCEAVRSAVGGDTVSVDVRGPHFEPVRASYLMCGSIAVIESAAACGLLISGDRDVMNATTYGVGNMINDAVKRGAKTVLLGLGGSATNDGGTGMASALGVKFLMDGKPFVPVGRTLCRIGGYDTAAADKLLKDVRIVACSDVTNPFFGKNGAACVYAPQKGASREEALRLDDGMKHLASLVKTYDLATLPGSGAAGGMAGGVVAFLNGEIRNGFDIFSGLIGYENKIGASDIIVTGEGKTDAQSANGKLPYGIAKLCRNNNKKCVLISGRIECDNITLQEAGFFAHYACTDSKSLPTHAEAAEALKNAAALAAKEISNL